MKHNNAAQQGNHVAHDLKDLRQLAKTALTDSAAQTMANEIAPVTKSVVDAGERAAIAIGQDLHGLGKVTKRLASEAVDAITEHASDYYEKGLKKAKSIEKSVERNVKDNASWYLLAAGIGLGIVAGAVVVGRRRRRLF